MSRITAISAFLTVKLCTSFIFDRGFVLDPARGAYDVPMYPQLAGKWKSLPS